EKIKLRRGDYRKRRSSFPFTTFFFLVLILGGYLLYRHVPELPEIEDNPPAPAQKLVLMGFEGADPNLIDRYWSDLPHLRALAEKGYRGTIASTVPPEGPVTWASIAVGAGPEIHGIFDSFRRPAGTYSVSRELLTRKEDAKYWFRRFQIRPPKYFSTIHGKPLWQILSENDVPAVLLRVPGTFPPPRGHTLTVLSGFGVPDLSEESTAFHHFSTRYEGEVQRTASGGRLIPLKKEQDRYVGTVFGPPDPVVQNQINELRQRRIGVCLKRLNAELVFWMRDRLSDAMAVDRDRFLETLCSLRAELLNGSRELQSKYLSDANRLIKVLVLPGSPEGNSLLDEAQHTPQAKFRTLIDESRKEEEELATRLRALEQSSGIAPLIALPISFRIVDENMAVVHLAGGMETLSLRQWTDWYPITFSDGSLAGIQGITRFYLQSIGPEFEVYMQPIGLSPQDPYIPISHPRKFSRDLTEIPEIGLFKARGSIEECDGFTDGVLDEKIFLEDLLETDRELERIALQTLTNRQWDFFFAVFPGPGRVTELMARTVDPMHPGFDPRQTGDPIRQMYVRMDEIVGNILRRYGEDKDMAIVVFSDHGVLSFRYRVNLNAWLVKQGYMSLKTSENGEQIVDWANTKAYSFGTGQIYLNLRGREPGGIVEASDSEALCGEICENLMRLTDDREGFFGMPVVREVRPVHGPDKDDSTGISGGDAPDLQVSFEAYYGSTLEKDLRSIPQDVIEDNNQVWSGGYRSNDPGLVPGILFCNRPVSAGEPSLIDLAPTALTYFGLSVPQEMQGKSLLSVSNPSGP
ncbi:MAG TPA: alkaline phosphatase family protein, partial [bacterium]|nr:alkaline phosphatase family protein [bacterium]